MVCETITVPADVTKPTGPTVDLALTIRRADPTKWTAPIALLVGEAAPRFFTLDRFTGHDIIGIDSRGDGRSLPNTECPDLAAYIAEINTRNLQTDAIAAVKACIAKAVAAPVSLAMLLDHHAAALDVATVRRSLGIDKWSVSTSRSSGDLVAHLLATDAGAISAVMAYTPYAVAAGSTANSENEAFTRFAADCASVPTCAAKGDLNALVAKMFGLPPVTTKTIEKATNWPVVLDSAAYRAGVAYALGDSAIAALLPGIIAGSIDGATNELTAGFFNTVKPVTNATRFSVACQDLGYIAPPLKGGGDDHAGPFKSSPGDRLCNSIGSVPQMVAAPKSSGTIPIMVVVPSYESAGSEPSAKALFAGYPNLTVVVPPGNPGSAPEFQPCYIGVSNAFMDSPTAKPDTSCLLSRDWVKFA